MKASELARILQAMIDEHGDMEVRLFQVGAMPSPQPRVVTDIPICGDGCCHGDEIWF